MAKRVYEELLMAPHLIDVKKSRDWYVCKDQDYFYKIAQEQNYSAKNGKMRANLEFQMQKENQVLGVNPVSDIYYVDQDFVAYRTPIAKGKPIKQKAALLGYSFLNWLPVICNLISVLTQANLKGYVFPDLFTTGNILIQEHGDVTFIDNDGIQVQNRCVGYMDSYAANWYFYSSQPISEKYFNAQEVYYTNQYLPYSFYAWFFSSFLRIDLFSYLYQQDYRSFQEQLTQIHFPVSSSCYEQCMNLFSFLYDSVLTKNDFAELFQNYELKFCESKRILVPRDR